MLKPPHLGVQSPNELVSRERTARRQDREVPLCPCKATVELSCMKWQATRRGGWLGGSLVVLASPGSQSRHLVLIIQAGLLQLLRLQPHAAVLPIEPHQDRACTPHLNLTQTNQAAHKLPDSKPIQTSKAGHKIPDKSRPRRLMSLYQSCCKSK